MRQKISYFILTLCIILSACEKLQVQNNDLTNTSKTPPKAKVLYYKNIPLPDKSEINHKMSLILGSDDNWTGRLVYKTPLSFEEATEFYLTEMPKMGFYEITTIRGKKTMITFERPPKFVALEIKPKGKKLCEIQVTVTLRSHQEAQP